MAAIDALDRDTRLTLFELLVAMSRTAGSANHDEDAAIEGAAVAFGIVHPDDREAVAESRAHPMDMDLSVLGSRGRQMALACAAWMTLADGVQTAAETVMFERIRRKLGVTRAGTSWLVDRAWWVRTNAQDGGSWWRELDELVTGIARELASHDVDAAA